MELIEYLPEYMRRVEDIKKIMAAEQPELDNINAEIEKAQNEMFIDTASEIGLSRLESIYKIAGSAVEDINFRRYRLMLKIMGGQHISLAERLDNIIGSGNYTMTFSFDEMRLRVSITVENQRYVKEAYKLLDRITPCNVILDVGILYTSHGMLRGYTHGELADYRHREIKRLSL